MHIGISVSHFIFWQFCDISGFSPLKMMILLGNKQNSLILLVFFSFSRMEIPVYNLGECTPWGQFRKCYYESNCNRTLAISVACVYHPVFLPMWQIRQRNVTISSWQQRKKQIFTESLSRIVKCQFDSIGPYLTHDVIFLVWLYNVLPVCKNTDLTKSWRSSFAETPSERKYI